MADRIPVVVVTPRNRVNNVTPRGGTRVVNRAVPDGGLGQLPTTEPPTGNTTRDPAGRRSNRLSTSAAQRELTVHGANAARPVHLGGPIPSGGFITFYLRTPFKLYIFFSVGYAKAPGFASWGYGAISNIRFGDKKASAINVTMETFLGAPGVVTSPLIQTVEPAFTFPEGEVGVACEFSWPNSVTGEYDPLAFTCNVEQGLLTPDCATEVVGFSRNVVRNARAMLIMRGFDPAVDLITADWIAAQAQAEFDITTGMASATPAPTLAVAPLPPGGSIEDGQYQSSFAWITAGVRSKMAPWSNIITFVGGASVRKLRSTGIAVGPGGTTAREAFRRKRNLGDNSWGVAKLTGTIADNVTTQFDDTARTNSLADGLALGNDPIKAWCIDLRIDAKDTLENWVDHVLSHGHGHLRYSNGQYGVWLEEPRDVSVDNEAVPIKFKDFGTDANTLTEFTFVEKGRAQVPTVVIVNHPDGASDFVDSSVMIPPNGPAPGLDWIELRVSRPGTTERQQAIRDGTKVYAQVTTCYRDPVVTARMDGMIPLIGERVYAESRKLLPATTNVGNAVVWPVHTGSVDGVDDVVVVDKVEHDGQVQLRFGLYRDTMFDNDITNDGSPYPPGDEDQLPDPPTNLVLTNIIFDGPDGRPMVRIKIEWTPADEPYTTFTQIMYSQDNGGTMNELGDFQDGPAYIEVSNMGVQHIVQMWTVRASTGQTSALVEAGIIPGFIDFSIPEATQFAWGITAIPGSTVPNRLEFSGPIPHVVSSLTPPPAPTNGGQSNSPIGLTPGTKLFAYSLVHPSGEDELSPPLSVTITGTTDDRLALDTPDQSDPLIYYQPFLRKYYMTLDGTTDPFYKIERAGPATTSINLDTPDADVTANDLAPAVYDGIRGWAIYDAFGIPVVDPVTSQMPLMKFLTRSETPHHYNMVDLTGMVHRDPVTGIPRIDAYVRVTRMDGGISAGVRFNQLAAVWPPQLPGIPAESIHATITLVNGANDNVELPDADYIHVVGPTATFWATGFLVSDGAGGFQDPVSGHKRWLVNETTFRFKLMDEDAGSNAAARVIVPGGSYWDVGGENGVTMIEYDPVTDTRWKPMTTNGVGAGPVGGLVYIYDTNYFGGTPQDASASVNGFFQARAFSVGATSTVTLANGTNTNVDVAAGSDSPGGTIYSFVRVVGPTAAFTIEGIPFLIAGMYLFMHLATDQQCTLVHDAVQPATPTDDGLRILCLNDVDYVIPAGTGRVIMLVRDGPSGGWRPVVWQ